MALRCIPTSDAWNSSGHGHCIDDLPILAVTVSWGVFIEMIIWTLPIPMVWRLHTTKSNKIALTGVFALGILDIVVGILRIITIVQLNLEDPTWSEAAPLYWVITEPSISIMVVSLPICRPLYEQLYQWTVRRCIRPCNTSHKTSEKHGSAHDNPENRLEILSGALYSRSVYATASGSLLEAGRNISLGTVADERHQNSLTESEEGRQNMTSDSDEQLQDSIQHCPSQTHVTCGTES